jgi:hypothetical protein
MVKAFLARKRGDAGGQASADKVFDLGHGGDRADELRR